ncbi:lipid IV(A) 3-deoxy-D-manno-octulosonic acid transferase [Acidihalobacter prosperus]|uniref:3-deoxy-D-manno-octulosonic acid transferase n=1 Tax=Acidihalobacter prosperus TaxID=160660 RepID=A0A1A6C4Y1_9GAMM|nr:lipid IV(A) 3-deoxy-D-manno-octulosonic acid transferase [Acidihalobacter prosperus]OBS09609.1 3-deoxy-D-manno-octulosonic acid transferase [Acidihalobacter prosperus]
MKWALSSFIYKIVLVLFAPFVPLRLLWRSRRNPAYRRRIGERFARFAPLPARPRLWVHAVSVGEVIAAAPLVRRLRQAYPEHAVLLTCTTPTGSAQIARLFGDTVEHVYLPYDLPHVVARFLDRTRPHLALIMETELWPNLFAACAGRDIPLMVANARLSERSAAGYARLRGLTRETLGQVTLIAAQDTQSARRFTALGARSVRVLGNLKYDLEVPAEMVARGRALRTGFGRGRPVWVAASTHPGEPEAVLAAFADVRKRFADALLILVPRHPERFGEAFSLCAQAGYRVARRSLGESGSADTDVLLGDTLGELLMLYAAADAAFVGGSLVPTGGHNPLEPASLGLPVVTGPYRGNFESIYEALIEAGAAEVVEDADALGAAMTALLGDPAQRRQAGSAGHAVVLRNRGALARTLEAVGELTARGGRRATSSV